MKPYVHFLSFLAQFLLEWEMSETKFIEKIKTHIMSNNGGFSPKIISFMRQFDERELHAG